MEKIALFYFCMLIWASTNAQTDTIYSETGNTEGFGRAFLDLIPELEFGFPIDDFKTGMGRPLMLGKGVSIFYRFKNNPIDVGIRLGDFSYDHLKRKFTNIDDIKIKQKTKNKIWIWYGAVRVEPRLNLPFPLYFEGAFGWRRYYIKTYFKEDIIDLTAVGNQRFDEETLHSDWGAVYGGAVGIKIILEKTYNTALDLQIGFKQSGQGVFYIDNNSAFVAEDPFDSLVERRAGFSMISFKVGFSLLGYGVE